jgi:hypothetical protein
MGMCAYVTAWLCHLARISTVVAELYVRLFRKYDGLHFLAYFPFPDYVLFLVNPDQKISFEVT